MHFVFSMICVSDQRDGEGYGEGSYRFAVPAYPPGNYYAGEGHRAGCVVAPSAKVCGCVHTQVGIGEIIPARNATRAAP